MQAPGSLSDGLIMKVLPHTRAKGNIHRGIIAGKLKGVIPAQTPSGILYDMASISFAIPDKDSPS
jgi:hypothetical protein